MWFQGAGPLFLVLGFSLVCLMLCFVCVFHRFFFSKKKNLRANQKAVRRMPRMLDVTFSPDRQKAAEPFLQICPK